MPGIPAPAPGWTKGAGVGGRSAQPATQRPSLNHLGFSGDNRALPSEVGEAEVGGGGIHQIPGTWLGGEERGIFR